MFARGNAKQPIFLDVCDHETYLAGLRRTVRDMRWRCLAYCLMGNHVHLVIETVTPNLGRGMHRLHGRYAQTFNGRHDRVGHLFQGRYGSVRMASDAQLLQTVRYVARNPLEAGLCTSMCDWPWSSHASLLSGTGPGWVDAARVLSFFGAGGGEPRERYRAFVEAGAADLAA